MPVPGALGVHVGHLPRSARVVSTIVGANMALRVTSVRDIGGFRHTYARMADGPPGGCDDIDVSLRLRRRSERLIMEVPGADVDHCVPQRRLTFSYLARRCYYEGSSRRRLMHVHGLAALHTTGCFEIGRSSEGRHLSLSQPVVAALGVLALTAGFLAGSPHDDLSTRARRANSRNWFGGAWSLASTARSKSLFNGARPATSPLSSPNGPIRTQMSQLHRRPPQLRDDQDDARSGKSTATWLAWLRQVIRREPQTLRALQPWTAVDQWTPRYRTRRARSRRVYGGLASYQIAGAFLSNCATVEDWGCGYGTFRSHCVSKSYVGIDGSKSPAAELVVDLRTYTSHVDGILLRHVLEHNPVGWDEILANALASFSRRMVLVTFTPFGERTRNLRRRPRLDTGVAVALSFDPQDLLAVIPPTVASYTIIGGALRPTETMFFFDKEQPPDAYNPQHQQVVLDPRWRRNI